MSETMIETIMPYGSVNVNTVRFLMEHDGLEFLVDNTGTQWRIRKEVFNSLKSKGYQVKEVRKR